MTGPAPDPNAELDDLDIVCRAIAHAARRHILLLLHVRDRPLTAGDIAGRFAHAWPTTTRHLKVLEHAGLVRVVARGRERFYELDRARLTRLLGGWLAWFDESAPLGSAMLPPPPPSSSADGR